MAKNMAQIPHPQKIEPFIEYYLQSQVSINVINGDNMSKQHVSEATIRSWHYMLKRLKLYAIKKKLKYVHSFTGNHLSDFINSEYKNTGNNTKRAIISYLNTFFDFAESEGACIDNEVRKLARPKKIIKEADYLNEGELFLWVQTIQKEAPTRLYSRDMLIAAFLIYPALRVEELVNLEIDNIDLSSNSLYIKVKGGHIRRKPISTDAREYLLHWLQYLQEKGINSRWLFPSSRKPEQRISTRAIEYMVKKYLQKAGLIKRSMGPHLIRHSGGSYLLKKGVDIRTVQQMLGHSKLSTTERYVHADFDDIVDAGEHINGLFG